MLAVPDDSSEAVMEETTDAAMIPEEQPASQGKDQGEEPSEGVSAGAGGI